MARIPAEQLRRLRNDVLISPLIERRLSLPTEYRSNLLRFRCPLCRHYNTAVNPDTNLARCFSCEKNFNPIDLVMAVNRCSFLEAVAFLQSPALSDR